MKPVPASRIGLALILMLTACVWSWGLAWANPDMSDWEVVMAYMGQYAVIGGLLIVAAVLVYWRHK